MNLAVAVIDDGISRETMPDLSFRLAHKKGIIQEEKKAISHLSHGSVCAAIIKKYAPQAKIGSIRVLGEKGRGNLDALLAALKWCSEQRIKLIHLSIGSTQASDVPALYEAVNEIVRNGGIIVAACKNGKNISFPATFPNVIGVRADRTLVGPQYIVNQEPNGGIELSASANHDLVLLPGTEPIAFSQFNSYAAPVISAAVFNLISSNEDKNIEEIRAELYRMAGSFSFEKQYYLKTVKYFASCSVTDNVPLVTFIGEKQLSLMRAVAGKLLNDNYLPLLFSQHKGDCSPECFYVEDLSLLANKCQEMACFYEADLILAVIKENAIDDVKAEAVIINDDTEIASSNLINSEGLDIDVLYNRLIAILEE
ncbi:MAG: S8 family serine peptidase [Lachnospiraceae bacterium]|nr:S8 family serine peptidase [Lachnospiraceae bacterium]